MPGQEKMVSVTMAPASKAPNCRPSDGEHGDQGVAQGVAVDDGALGQAFGAGGADVVLAELFEHGGADHAGEDGGEGAAHGEGGQDEVGERSGAGDGEPSEFDGEEQDEDGAEGEVGERQAEEADDGEQAVVPAIAAVGGADAGGDREAERDEQRRQREAQRVGIGLGEAERDGVVEADGASEVAVEDAFPVVEVLLAERGVEAVGVAGGGDVGGGAPSPSICCDGVSGDEVDEQEDEADHQPDYWEGVEDALEDGFQGALGSLLGCHPERSERERACGVEGSLAARLVYDLVREFR